MLSAYRERPRLALPADGLDKALELCGAVLLALFLIVVAGSWSMLPEQLPTHFGLNGEPDSWGSRLQVLVLPAIALLQFVLMTVLARMPHRYNYMVPITPDNAERQYRLARRLMHGLKLLVVLLLFAIYLAAWGVAAGRFSTLPATVMWLLLAPIMLLLGWYLLMARRAR